MDLLPKHKVQGAWYRQGTGGRHSGYAERLHERIRCSLDEARKQGLAVTITTGEIDGAHPNTAQITLMGKDGKQVSLLGSSTGGGNILVTRINGMEVSLTGEKTTLIAFCTKTLPVRLPLLLNW